MLDLLTATPTDVAFGAKTYRVGPLKLHELGLLQRWIREHAEKPADPIAARDWPPTIGSEAGNRLLLGSDDGQRHFLKVLFGKYLPAIDDAEVDSLMKGLSPEDFGILVATAFGEDGTDPKDLKAASRPRASDVPQDDPSTGPPSSPL